MNAKKIIVLKLLNCFPSFAQNDETIAAGVTAAILDAVAKMPDDIVEEACQTLMRRHNSPFAPSAGQIYAECEKIIAKRPKPAPVSALPAPEYSEEHRERMKRRFAALVAEIASGQSRDPNYGHVAKGTPPTKPIVNRVVRESFLERWKRENGRPYPRRAELLNILDADIRKAAE